MRREYFTLLQLYDSKMILNRIHLKTIDSQILIYSTTHIMEIQDVRVMVSNDL